MKDTIKLPMYVRIGRGSCMRLKGNLYWRDGGGWGIRYKIKDGKLLTSSYGMGMPWLNNLPIIEVTKSEWAEDNKGYI